MFRQKNMKILILTNYDVGLYQFRQELILELLKNNEVYISLPYGKLVEPLKQMGFDYVVTELDAHSKTLGAKSIVESEFAQTIRGLLE